MKYTKRLSWYHGHNLGNPKARIAVSRKSASKIARPLEVVVKGPESEYSTMYTNYYGAIKFCA